MRVLIVALFLATLPIFAGPTIELVNTEGNSFEAEILSLNESETTVRRTTDQRVFVLPLSSLSAGTQTLLKENENLITTVHPDYLLEPVIGKRRKKKDGSSYWVIQTLTCKVGIKNESRELDSPGVKLRVILVGQNQRYRDRFVVLTAQDFEAAPLKTRTEEVTLKEVKTEYDSDNEGEGNLGGYKYEDYIFLLMDKEGKVLQTKTLNSDFASALESQAGIIDRMKKVQEGTYLGKDLKPAETNTTRRF